ncbi:MAG: hypothetical protein CPDRYMAC_1533 [uncultured Paraburkholderia sp.]|nr:MAG: hypothetical protein CPDRYDRY_1480 [uncultured Paraburkholderia sp.]CAH2918980.1 MAG: hypothetical protein CPDRYMAC_1533 [uncultured Paraburkholderia sp.]
MSQASPSKAQSFSAQPVRASASGFSASMQSPHTVALSLLVDRALSA